MNRAIAYLLTVTPLLLSGCTSLKDFQKMDANSRAEFVCNRDDSVRHYGNTQSLYQSKIDDILATLERGYRVHRSCKTVNVDQPDTLSCRSTGNGKNTICTQSTRTVQKEICTETPVAINVDLEKEKLEKYRVQMESIRIEKNTAYYHCFSKVHPMSAEEAFNYYDNR